MRRFAIYIKTTGAIGGQTPVSTFVRTESFTRCSPKKLYLLRRNPVSIGTHTRISNFEVRVFIISAVPSPLFQPVHLPFSIQFEIAFCSALWKRYTTEIRRLLDEGFHIKILVRIVKVFKFLKVIPQSFLSRGLRGVVKRAEYN